VTGRQYLLAATALISVIFIAANLVLQPLLAPARIDFTERSLYTLADGTRETLKGLAEPVEVTFVYTRSVGQDYPAVRAYAARVRELLDAYKTASGGALNVRVIDPAPFSAAEDEALAAGVNAIETSGSDPLYFGIIGRNAVDDERIIPFLAPERETSLEYDLTRLISRLDKPEPPTVGILTDLPGMAVRGGEGGYTLLQDISQSFGVEQIQPEFVELPEGMDVLLLAHPPKLTDHQAWLIDQFLMRNGRAVFVIDPAAKIAVGGGVFPSAELHTRSDLGVFSSTWGVALSDNAVADVEYALPVPIEDENGRVELQNHPLFPAPPAAGMNQQDVITADLSRAVNFGAPGALETAALSEGLTFSPLIISGPSPSFIDAKQAAGNMTPAEVLRDYESLGRPLALAGRLSGPLKSAFPAGAPAMPEPADPILAELAAAAAARAPEHLNQSQSDAEIVIIADVDLLYDDFYVIPDNQLVTADNGALVLNALDALAGGGELSRLRSRAASLRPMTRIDKMRSAAESEYFAEQRDLEAQLETAQSRLEELQDIGASEEFFSGDVTAELSNAERAELSSLREDIFQMRARMRGIQRDYRRNIDGLEATLKAVNIWGGPILVGLLGLLVWRREQNPPGGGDGS
jgi:ABC-type uncharacterized transport system involved in gliding motility auxiliary subunit